MPQVSKIDSNSTGLSYAEEASVGVLPAVPVWNQMEPNEYDSFGGEIKTVARNPINASRQRKKGVVVDLDAKGGFTIDVTQEATQDLMQGFLFADARSKLKLSVADVSAVYAPAAGGGDYAADDLLFAKGFTKTANNGLRQVTGTPSASSIAVVETLEAENGSSGSISKVGHQFGSGVAAIDVSGSLPKLTVTGNVAASGVLTTTGSFTNAETITIDGVVYTIKDVLTTAANDVKKGANVAATLTNIVNAINRNGLGTPGTDYSAATVAHPSVSASATSTALTVTARKKGTAGNAIATTTTALNATWGTATLTSGAGKSLKDVFGLTVGEWVVIGDDTIGTQFANAVNNGLKRVRIIEDDALTFDKSTLAMVADVGTGKTLRVFIGSAIKNEQGSLIKRRSYQFERQLGAPDEAVPAAIQAEYLTGSIANELELTIKQADKVTAKLSFMSRDHETKTAAEGLKDGLRPTLQESDAFNSTSHVARASIAVVDPTNEAPTDLFAFIMDLSLTINNNVSANKAIKVLGAFDNTAGTFEVDAECSAYFATVEAIRTVRDNADVTLDLTFAQANRGITFDLPLVSVGDALADVKQDEAIMLPIKSAAATAAKLDVNLNHTLLVQYWDYIPALAA